MRKQFRAISLFSGAGGMDVGFETTGSRFSYSLVSEGDVMTVFEALYLMIAFATLVVLILTYRK